MNRNKEIKISASLMALAIVINFVNYIFFYNDINPFYEFFSFLAFIAGTLGITVFPLGIAAVIAVLFIISKKHKHSYLYYFAILFLILSLFSLVISVSNAAYERDAPNSTSESAPIPKPKSAGPIQSATGELVFEVDENGLSINKDRFNMDSTLDDYIKILGNPSRVTELMNTIHTYDDAGIMLYQPLHSNEITQVSIDFNRGDYEFSPKHTFQGVLIVGHLSVDSSLHSDSLGSIPGLTMEDWKFGKRRGTLGNIILHFDYRELRERLDSLAISFSN